MIIYKDIISEDELLSDSFKVELVDDVVYKVKGKYITTKQGIDESAIGGNKSAEGGEDEGTDDTSTTEIDIIVSHKLQQVATYSKKEYGSHIKTYMKRIIEHVPEDEKNNVKAKLSKYVAEEIMGKWKEHNFDIYLGESMDGEAMNILVTWEDDNTPVFHYFKHGMREEKF